MRALLFVVISTALLLLAGLIWWVYVDQSAPEVLEPQACTLEAKLCPDGSAVGRTGPNCSFAPCPTGTP